MYMRVLEEDQRYSEMKPVSTVEPPANGSADNASEGLREDRAEETKTRKFIAEASVA